MKKKTATPGCRLQVNTHSAEQTRELGKIIGKGISTGLFIAMTGELGSGKTVFVQGLAAGLEVRVADPVFIGVQGTATGAPWTGECQESGGGQSQSSPSDGPSLGVALTLRFGPVIESD